MLYDLTVSMYNFDKKNKYEKRGIKKTPSTQEKEGMEKIICWINPKWIKDFIVNLRNKYCKISFITWVRERLWIMPQNREARKENTDTLKHVE